MKKYLATKQTHLVKREMKKIITSFRIILCGKEIFGKNILDRHAFYKMLQ